MTPFPVEICRVMPQRQCDRSSRKREAVTQEQNARKFLSGRSPFHAGILCVFQGKRAKHPAEICRVMPQRRRLPLAQIIKQKEERLPSPPQALLAFTQVNDGQIGKSGSRENLRSDEGSFCSHTLRIGEKLTKSGHKLSARRRSRFIQRLLYINDSAAVILPTALAGTVGHAERPAVGASDHIGSNELPSGRTPLVTPLSGYFSFWDCHVDTSI